MKRIYFFLMALLGIASFATGQNHPKQNDINLTILSISDTAIIISKNIESKEAL